ncbi:hypothetical protein NKZ03_30900 [Sinorhizobium meliloti]|jgi:hypothetical protein|uniref:hypothetical protein n=1 Tax=Rhizobium meliloti TaxID=382 RepID=UPI000D1F7CAD|nr:hypothetical protein [Sinorhizobium meliloti]MDW9416675.1 hypothetical protein [Sinorhizobium meliloti]MDW9483871.1 hypothetical protein [Sinorhizobium meliloti]MDW9513498.1 hypothetical protein [Sinorhizobium meliloti]MDW9640217.1 hypothetical protein [Sinorhizobium meliloti]MDW9669159.1 hypothetical protein [Sinorhizobium meliloti]
MSVPASSRERKSYWISLVSLLAAVPLAVLVGSRGEFAAWLQRRMESPVTIERDGSVQGTGGSWRLISLRRLPGTLPDTSLMLAEIDLSVEAADVLQQALPCALSLTDGTGRRWDPLPLPGRLLREADPEVADSPQCTTLTIGEAGDAPLRVVELFLVPRQADGFTLSLALTGSPPILLK